MLSMTKRITVSLPDDIAERLSRQSNVSAFVTESLRRRFAGLSMRETLTELGFTITDEDLAQARDERERQRAASTPEQRAAALKLANEVRAARGMPPL